MLKVVALVLCLLCSIHDVYSNSMNKGLRPKIIALRVSGKSYREIEKELGCARSNISFHLNKSVRIKSNARQQCSRNRLRKKLKLELGGACSKCGYSVCLAALDFHHADPSTKLFSLSAAFRIKSFSSLREEVKKCILLCANCHRELHDAESKIKYAACESNTDESIMSRTF